MSLNNTTLQVNEPLTHYHHLSCLEDELMMELIFSGSWKLLMAYKHFLQKRSILYDEQ